MGNISCTPSAGSALAIPVCHHKGSISGCSEVTPPSHSHTCSVFNFSWCGVDSHCTAVHQAALHVYLASVTDILHCQKPPRFPSAGVFGMMLAVICNELNSVSFGAGAHGVSSSCISADALTCRAAPASLSVLSSHLSSAPQVRESC